MSEFRADLHCHSTCSDGTYTPEALIELAVEKGLQGLSITDHDTIEAYQHGFSFAEERGIKLITGAEFSAMHQQTSVHILAYSFPFDSPILKELSRKHTERRQKRNQAILKLLAEHEMFLDESDLLNSEIPKQTIGRPHIAVALLKKGYITSLQEAFNKYIGEGKPCYVPGHAFSVEETIETIHQAQGFAIIAHPHLIENTKVLKDLLDMPFDGLEGYYSRFPMHEQKRWIKMAKYRHWMFTGGSDFHGSIKPMISLGCSWVDEEIFAPLYERFKINHPSLKT